MNDDDNNIPGHPSGYVKYFFGALWNIFWFSRIGRVQRRSGHLLHNVVSVMKWQNEIFTSIFTNSAQALKFSWFLHCAGKYSRFILHQYFNFAVLIIFHTWHHTMQNITFNDSISLTETWLYCSLMRGKQNPFVNSDNFIACNCDDSVPHNIRFSLCEYKGDLLSPPRGADLLSLSPVPRELGR